MKKYIFNLFPNQPIFHNTLVRDLACHIALYNHEQPEQDFINYLHNAIPYSFLYFEVGNNGTIIDVQSRDEYSRIGRIEIVDIPSK